MLSIVNQYGVRQLMSYDAGTGLLSTIADHFGRMLSIAYDSSGRLASLTQPDGRRIAYGYDTSGLLVSVQYPDGSTMGYQYRNGDFSTLMTEKIDGNGVIVAAWTYSGLGQALTSQLAGGIATAAAVFDGNTTVVTDAAGVTRTRQYVRTASNLKRVASVSLTCAGCEPGLSSSVSYDSRGFIASETDLAGLTIQYTRDASGLILSKTIGAGTALAETTTYTWHPVYRQPVTITMTNSRVATFTYDGFGNMLARTFSINIGTSSQQSRTTSYLYNSMGQLLRVTGPRADGTDITSMSYDTQGNLSTVTNPLGQVAQYTQYDAVGRPLQFRDETGQVFVMTYDNMGRVATRTIGTRTTSYTYDLGGLLRTVSYPTGDGVTLGYDAAHS